MVQPHGSSLFNLTKSSLALLCKIPDYRIWFPKFDNTTPTSPDYRIWMSKFDNDLAAKLAKLGKELQASQELQPLRNYSLFGLQPIASLEYQPSQVISSGTIASLELYPLSSLEFYPYSPLVYLCFYIGIFILFLLLILCPSFSL